MLELNHKVHAEEVAAWLWDKETKNGKVKDYLILDDEGNWVEQPDSSL